MARLSSEVWTTSGSRPASAQQLAAAARLGHPLLGQVDVDPAGEQVLGVPLALAVAEQDQRVRGARDRHGPILPHAGGLRPARPRGPGPGARRRPGCRWTRPADVRHSHSRRMAEAKPSSRMVLKEPSAYSRTAPMMRSSSPRGDGGQRESPDQVDVAEVVDGEGDRVHPPVALEQPAVDGLVVLVGMPCDERVHGERVLADREGDGRAQLADAGDVTTNVPGPPGLPLEAGLRQELAHRRLGGSRAHERSAATCRFAARFASAAE